MTIITRTTGAHAAPRNDRLSYVLLGAGFVLLLAAAAAAISI